jgi:hypothetical protein
MRLAHFLFNLFKINNLCKIVGIALIVISIIFDIIK